MLYVDELYLQGKHGDLLSQSSFELPSHELSIVTAEKQDTRTTATLLLSARMKPTSGAVFHNHSSSIKALRLHTAPIDAVGVNEPEPHLRLSDLVNEDLALIPPRERLLPTSEQWFAQTELTELSQNWIDQIDPATRMYVLCELALSDSRVDTLVIDTPERHSPNPDTWLPYLLELSESKRATVVVLTASAPTTFDGPLISLGSPTESEHP